MEIGVREVGGIAVVDITGGMCLYNTAELKRTANSCIETGQTRMILNLTRVAYIDSAGLGVLISLLDDLKPPAGALRLVGLNATLNKIFKLMRLDKCFEILDTVENAVISLAP